MRDSYDYGILGVGELGAAIVTGLCQGTDAAPGILLSPRSAARTALLAARYPSVSVAPDNQALADRCAVVVLSVRPADAAEVLGKLTFRAGQAVIGDPERVAHWRRWTASLPGKTVGVLWKSLKLDAVDPIRQRPTQPRPASVIAP